MLSPTRSTPGREIQLGLRIEDVQLVRLDRELDRLACLHLLVRRHESDDLVALGLRMDELFVAEVLDDVDLRREAAAGRAAVAVQLQILWPEADQKVPTLVLLRRLRGRAGELERRAAQF